MSSPTSVPRNAARRRFVVTVPDGVGDGRPDRDIDRVAVGPGGRGVRRAQQLGDAAGRQRLRPGTGDLPAGGIAHRRREVHLDRPEWAEQLLEFSLVEHGQLIDPDSQEDRNFLGEGLRPEQRHRLVERRAFGSETARGVGADRYGNDRSATACVGVVAGPYGDDGQRREFTVVVDHRQRRRRCRREHHLRRAAPDDLSVGRVGDRHVTSDADAGGNRQTDDRGDDRLRRRDPPPVSRDGHVETTAPSCERASASE